MKDISLISVAAILLLVSACSDKKSNSAVNDTAPKTVTAASSEAKMTVVSLGTFTGRSNHITTGGVSVVKSEEGYKLVLANDFSLDGAPDPVVALGNNGEYDVANKLAVLSNKTGAQSYIIPANMTPTDFSEAYIWCEKFNVPLGVATLTAKN